MPAVTYVSILKEMHLKVCNSRKQDYSKTWRRGIRSEQTDAKYKNKYDS